MPDDSPPPSALDPADPAPTLSGKPTPPSCYSTTKHLLSNTFALLFFLFKRIFALFTLRRIALLLLLIIYTRALYREYLPLLLTGVQDRAHALIEAENPPVHGPRTEPSPRARGGATWNSRLCYSTGLGCTYSPWNHFDVVDGDLVEAVPFWRGWEGMVTRSNIGNEWAVSAEKHVDILMRIAEAVDVPDKAFDDFANAASRIYRGCKWIAADTDFNCHAQEFDKRWSTIKQDMNDINRAMRIEAWDLAKANAKEVVNNIEHQIMRSKVWTSSPELRRAFAGNFWVFTKYGAKDVSEKLQEIEERLGRVIDLGLGMVSGMEALEARLKEEMKKYTIGERARAYDWGGLLSAFIEDHPNWRIREVLRDIEAVRAGLTRLSALRKEIRTLREDLDQSIEWMDKKYKALPKRKTSASTSVYDPTNRNKHSEELFIRPLRVAGRRIRMVYDRTWTKDQEPWTRFANSRVALPYGVDDAERRDGRGHGKRIDKRVDKRDTGTIGRSDARRYARKHGRRAGRR